MINNNFLVILITGQKPETEKSHTGPTLPIRHLILHTSVENLLWYRCFLIVVRNNSPDRYQTKSLERMKNLLVTPLVPQKKFTLS